MSSKVEKARKRVADAEEALAQAKREHEEDFKRALVALFNEYHLSVDVSGVEGARLEISEIQHEFKLEHLYL